MFPSSLDNYYTDLDDWLDIATSGLADAAKARVIEEMSAHYAEAVDDLIADGVSREEAEVRALDELGSPVDAREAYDRKFAVPEYVRTLERYQGELAGAEACKNKIRLREAVFVLVTLYLLMNFSQVANDFDDANRLLSAIAMLAFFAIYIVAPRVARHVAVKRGKIAGIRAIFVAHVSARMVFIAALWTMNAGQDVPLLLRGVAPVILLLVTAQEIYHWHKIQPMLCK